MTAEAVLLCPECGCERVYRDGLRYLSNGETAQRFLCRSCGYRFTDPAAKTLKVFQDNRGTVQLCVVKEAKKLDTTAISKIAAGIESQEIKGNLTVYIAKASQRGLAEATIKHNLDTIAWLAKTTDLNDPVKVWLKIDNQKTWSHGTKQHHASAYKNYAKIMKMPLPEDLDFNKWVLYDRLPKYIPTENEVTQLISGCNKKTAPMRQLIVETGIRSGEAWLLKWDNFDFERKTLMLNAENCEKKGIPRQFKINDTLIAMLNLLKLKSKNAYIWNTERPRSLENFRSMFHVQRKQLARKLQNPNLMKVTLHTLRHFYACKLYHNTKDLLLVKAKLGHRNIQNTLVYTRLVDWERPDTWTVRRPTTTIEEDALIEAGFEYVRFDNQTQTPIYRKRK
jgi:integrase